MSITVSCKTCKASYTVKDALAGRTAECKHCGHKFTIPYRSVEDWWSHLGDWSRRLENPVRVTFGDANAAAAR